MLVEKYDLEVFTPPCEPGAERFSAIARLVVDIREVLPYLNATLRGARYNPAAPALQWTKGGHNIVFHPYQIAVSNVLDREAAIQEVEGLVKLVNRTWERRAEITPDYEEHRRPTPPAVYKLLPGANCQRCGEPTCFTFAVKLATAQRRLEDCPPLLEPQYAAQLAQLREMVIEAPAIGQAGMRQSVRGSSPSRPAGADGSWAGERGKRRAPGRLLCPWKMLCRRPSNPVRPRPGNWA